MQVNFILAGLLLFVCFLLYLVLLILTIKAASCPDRLEELQEMVGGGLVAEGEELFALEGVPPVYSHYSEEEREESEPDEGIHIPAKFREKKLTEVNYNFKIINLGRQCF